MKLSIERLQLIIQIQNISLKVISLISSSPLLSEIIEAIQLSQFVLQFHIANVQRSGYDIIDEEILFNLTLTLSSCPLPPSTVATHILSQCNLWILP